MRKLSILLLFIFITVNHLFAQNNSIDSIGNPKQFIQYVNEKALYDDAFSFLKSRIRKTLSQQQNDSLYGELAHLYIKTNNLDSANKYFKSIHSYRDSVLLLQAIKTAFSQYDTATVHQYLNHFARRLNSYDLKSIKISLQMLERKAIDTVLLKNDSSEIKFIAIRYSQYKKKSAVVAGMLSTTIPGLGKRYLGYKKQGKGAFITNLTLAGIATEVLLKTANPLPIIAACSAFGTFYIGNIWGSILLAKKRERDYFNQIDSDIMEMYSNKLQQSKINYNELSDNYRIQKLQLLQNEYKIWKAKTFENKTECIFAKAKILKQTGNIEKALTELNRIDSIPNVHKSQVLYEKALYSFLLKNYNESYNYLLEIPDSIRLNERPIARLWFLTLIENKQWEQCKSNLKQLYDSSEYNAHVKNLATTITYKSPIKAQRLSSFLPGLGLMYSHKPSKALTNFILEASCITIATTLFISGYYFTPIIVGIYPFWRFYRGGKELSYEKAVTWNTNKEIELKRKYRDVVYLLVK